MKPVEPAGAGGTVVDLDSECLQVVADLQPLCLHVVVCLNVGCLEDDLYIDVVEDGDATVLRPLQRQQ